MPIDLSAGLVAKDTGGIDLSAGLVPASEATPDSRNAIQKGFDALVNVTPEQEKGHSALYNKAQEFGAGAIQGAFAPIVHPVDTLTGLATAVAHPIDTAKGMAANAIAHPAQALGNLVGGVVAGEGAAAGAGAVNKLATPTLSRVLLKGETPAGAYESALKPSTTLSQAERGRIVQTGLENSIPVSKGGFAKLASQIQDLDNARTAAIAKDPTRPVQTVGAVRNLDSVRARFANQVTPQDDLAEINHVEQNFLTNPKIAPQGAGPSPSSLSAVDAQAMKSGTYRALGDKSFGELKGANIEAQKALARGIKDEIAVQFPELKALNATESRLLDLEPALERAINRIGNHQLIGIGTPVAGAAATAVTGSATIGKVAMALKAVLDHPTVKSRLAIAISKGAGIPYARAVARVAAYSSALQSSVDAPQGYSSGDSPSQPTTPQP